MFSRITKKGHFKLSSGVRSSYDYDYSMLTDAMSKAYCLMLYGKLEKWQSQHGKLDVVVGLETEGIRIGCQLAEIMRLPFLMMPHEQNAFAQLPLPPLPPDPHWLFVDDIVTTGSSFIRAINFLDIQEKPESVTFACMIRRNPANLDYSAVHGDHSKNELHIIDRRFDFIDKRLVSLYNEPE